jgi:drug/metabolite transporter (DMT)-like permease
MTNLMVALVILSWGIAGIFDKKALENGSLRSVFLTFGLFNLPLAAILLVVLTCFYPHWHLSAGTILWESADAAASMIAIATYYYAMSRSEASYVLAITAGYPLVGALLAIPLLGEPFSLLLVAAALAVSAGVAIVGCSDGGQTQKLARSERFSVVACVLVSTILWGLLGIFQKQSLHYGQPLESMLAMAAGKSIFVAAALLFMLRGKQPLGLRNLRTWQFTWLSGFLVALGNVSYITALATLPAGYMVVITACYPIVMYVFALILLREKVNYLRMLGIALVVTGAALTALV